MDFTGILCKFKTGIFCIQKYKHRNMQSFCALTNIKIISKIKLYLYISL